MVKNPGNTVKKACSNNLSAYLLANIGNFELIFSEILSNFCKKGIRRPFIPILRVQYCGSEAGYRQRSPE
jgi:hypothetical protein